MHVWFEWHWLCLLAGTGGVFSMFTARLFFVKTQMVSCHILACSVSETAPLNLCHVCSNISDRWCCYVLTCFGLNSENASGGTLPCLSLCSGGTVPGGILTCFGMFVACLCIMWVGVVGVNDILHGSVWAMPGAILSSRQDTTRSCKNPKKKMAGLAGLLVLKCQFMLLTWRA